MTRDSVNDRNFLQIVVDLTIIRIYYLDKQFYMCYVDSENIFPTMFKKAHKARDYLMDKLQDKKNIDVRLFYRNDIPIEKKIGINELNGYYCDLTTIYKSLLLLIE